MANHTPIGPMIDGISRIMRTRGYSPRTEDSYLRWIERFLRFHDRPHWKTLLGVHAEDFLDHLANDAGLAANSRNEAASALAFLLPPGPRLGRDGELPSSPWAGDSAACVFPPGGDEGPARAQR